MAYPKTPYPLRNLKFLPLRLVLEENKLSRRHSQPYIHSEAAANSDLNGSQSKDDLLNEIIKDYYNLSSESSLGRILISSSLIANRRKIAQY